MKLCEHCREREATVHYQKTVNGKTVRADLCASCAKKMGIGVSFGLEENLFGGLDLFSALSGTAPKGEGERCPLCNTTLAKIRKEGKFGCSQCYDQFADRLDLNSFVGKGYGGKALGAKRVEAETLKEAPKEIDPVLALKEELKAAVAAEDYEKAAVLRDRIREKEGK